MLTKQERKWLEHRDDVCFRCSKNKRTCSPALRKICRDIGFPIKDRALMKEPDYCDAAEFAERVAAKLTLEEPCPLPENANLSDCPYFTEDDGSAFSCRWCRLKRARIAVEEEMDNGKDA
jgi:hypothetical protein|nr:MAG TPA: hypothetical protein [Caudoviricetes sp.]